MCKRFSCRPRPWCARSPPHWCARSPKWAATSRISCRPKSQHDSRPNSNNRAQGAFMIRLLALLAALFVAAPAQAQSDPQNTLVLETTKGNVVIRLRNDIAPEHANRIKQLARDGFYNNVPFHRVIPGFMAQTGDGDRGNGTGKSKYPNLKSEFSQLPFKRGVIGMARASDPNSANCQFFITYADAPHLNGQYTVVGEVVSGMDNVDKIKKGEPVVDPDRIVRAFVQADGKK